MKKLTAAILALILVLSLCACSSTKSTNTNNETQKPETSTTKPEQSDNTPNAKTYTIADEVIVDNENCTFKIVKAEVDKLWGFKLKTYCENKTSDKALMFSIDDVSVNGYMSDPFWAEEVAPGKKTNGDITFPSSDFEAIGLSFADEITFTLRVYDSDDWSADDYVKDTFTIYPTGLSASEIVYPERRISATEQVVVDNDDICFIILDQKDDSFWGYTLNCYIENKTDKRLMFSWDDVSVNGFMIDPFWAKGVAPGMKCYSGISFSTSDFEENSITEVENIEYTVRAYDSDNWLSDDIYNNTLTYLPQ
ncbi:MAG: hypothetical protein IJU78_04195 [Clostridia bacterium]|nr:hypothetical protein [Clostridia bacterium]